MDKVLEIMSESTNRSPHIRDCRRLGQYVQSRAESHPQPVLITLGSVFEVNYFLAHIPSTSGSSVSVRRDLSPEDRALRSILLKERWKLIESGTDRGKIRIRNSSLFVDGEVFGTVVDSTFTVAVPDSDISDLGPSPSRSATGATAPDPGYSNVPRPVSQSEGSS